jgi:hypothetical protein
MNPYRKPSSFHALFSRKTRQNTHNDSGKRKRMRLRQILANYRLYRADMRKYKAQKRYLKAVQRKQERAERKQSLDNPFFQLFYAKERSKKIVVDTEGNVLYVPSYLNSFLHILNSTLSFLVAYLLVYMLYQFAVMFVASFQEIYGVLYYYKLDFNDHSSNWTVLNIIAITLSGPLISLVLGLTFYNHYFFKARNYYSLRLFFYWFGILGFAYFFAAFISGVITNKGFGFVPLWLFWSDFTKFFFALIALVSMVLIGYFSAARLQATSNNSFRIQRESRALFFAHQSVIPYVLGSAIIFLIKIPNNQIYDTLTLVFGFILSVSVLFNLKAPNYPWIKTNKPAFLNYALFLLCLVLLYSWRVYLADGLHILIKFLIEITPK